MDRRNFLKLGASATAYFFAPVGGWKSDVIVNLHLDLWSEPQIKRLNHLIVDILIRGTVWMADGTERVINLGDKPIILSADPSEPPYVKQSDCAIIRPCFDFEEGYRF